ncbi:MAG: hypothetical protein VR65_11580 [Desulfobulbaceae bacterium BRH_c16a]|nr:MAG: hypothetical protein VR65_11580 [Desulfobulbaceae bacterium BRH_c16a]
MTRLLILLFCLVVPGDRMAVFAAQSTADVPVSVEQKNILLQELFETKAEKMEREEEYVIGHGDILSVSIYEEGDMALSASVKQPGDGGGAVQTGAQVMMDGRLSLKDIGDVEVVGLTLAELADYLKKLYSTLYDNPILTTTLVQSNSLRYTVMGEVARPGVFKLDHPINLVQVLAQSGGFTEWAGREITVVRKKIREADKAQFDGNTLKVDYDDFVSGKSLERNIFVCSGDIVIVN